MDEPTASSSPLRRLFNLASQHSARLALFVLAIGAVAAISGTDVGATVALYGISGLAAGLTNNLITTLGSDAIVTLLDRASDQDISNEDLLKELQAQFDATRFNELLTENEFKKSLAKVMGRQERTIALLLAQSQDEQREILLTELSTLNHHVREGVMLILQGLREKYGELSKGQKEILVELDEQERLIVRGVQTILMESQKQYENLHKGQMEIVSQIKGTEDILSGLNDELLQLSGIAMHLVVQDIKPPQPDGIPFTPPLHLDREELILEIEETLKEYTWLALVEGPGKGKTQLALSIYKKHDDPRRAWISLRNKGDLSIIHFQEQLVLWLIQLTGNQSMWTQYSIGSFSFTDIVVALTNNIGSGSLLVIDDLPDPIPHEDLYSDIEIITRELSNKGLNIVTTSQRALPPKINIQSHSLIVTRSCQNFSIEEIQELLNQSLVPKEHQTENIAIWISATTKGLPSLVIATINWLEKKGAQISLDTYAGLLSGEPLKETLEYHRRLLLHVVDSSSKEFLYRLSLIGEQFNRDLAMEVAIIPPSINKPGDCLDNLIGPWLEPSTLETLEVSPLLANSGRDNLPFELQKEVHLLVVEQYLKDATININNAHNILLHLWQAHDYVRFANTLIQLLLSAQTQKQAKYVDWACKLVFGVEWPEEINLGLRIMIRGAQLRTLALAGKKYQEINEDFELQLSKADFEEHGTAILFAYVIAGLINEDLPVEITLPRSFGVVRLISSSPTLKKALSVDLLEHLPNAVWSQGMRIKNREEIKLFIENFSSLSQSDRDYLLTGSFATEVSTHLMDQSWYSEASKPPDERNWETVFSFLDEIMSDPHIQGCICFQVAIARSRAVIYADYLKQADKAIELLESLPQLTNPDALFQVNYTKGCFSTQAGKSDQAISYFSLAEEINGSGYSYYRIDNTKRLAIEMSRKQEWETAKTLCIDVIHRFSKDEGKDAFIWERYEMFGELAFIHWSTGDILKACAAMFGFVIGLVREGDVEDPRYREAINKAGYALGRFVSVSSTGKPPSVTMQGEEYSPIQAGVFGIRRENLGDVVPPAGYSKAILITQLAIFTNGSGLKRMSWYLNKLSLEYYRREGKTDDMMLVTVYPDLTYLESIYGDPTEALKYALQTKEFLAIVSTINRTNTPVIPGVELKKGDLLSEVLEEDYQTGERRLLYVIFSPLFTHFMGENIPLINISEELEHWKFAITAHEKDLHYAKEWIKVIQYYSDLTRFWKEGQEIDNEFEVFDDKTTFEILRYLLSSDRPNFSLENAFSYQISAIITLPNYGQYARYMLHGLGKFIHRYWLNIARTRRFALRNPDQFLEGLESISPDGRGYTLVQTLKSASRALGINIPSDARELLNQVKDL